HSLVGADRPTVEYPATFGVRNGNADGEIHGADQTGDGNDPLGVEYIEKLLPAAMEGAQKLVRLNSDIVEVNVRRRQRIGAEFFDRRMGDTRSLRIDQKKGDAFGFLADLLEFSRPGDEEHLGGGIDAGDPYFSAVKTPAAAFGRCKSAIRQTIRTGIRFSQCHAAVHFARNDARKENLFHRLGAETRN